MQEVLWNKKEKIVLKMKTKLEETWEKKQTNQQTRVCALWEKKSENLNKNKKRKKLTWCSLPRGIPISNCGNYLTIHSHAVYLIYLYYTSVKYLK